MKPITGIAAICTQVKKYGDIFHNACVGQLMVKVNKSHLLATLRQCLVEGLEPDIQLQKCNDGTYLLEVSDSYLEIEQS